MALKVAGYKPHRISFGQTWYTHPPTPTLPQALHQLSQALQNMNGKGYYMSEYKIAVKSLFEVLSIQNKVSKKKHYALRHL